MSGGAGSLQRRLTLAVVCVVGLALAGLAAALSFQYGRTNWERFDERLAAAAQQAASAVDGNGAQPLDPAALAPDQSRGRTHLRVWAVDGTPIATYPPGETVLAPPGPGAAPRFERVALPGGEQVRVYRAWIRPGPSGRQLAVAVARETAQVDARLSRFRAVVVVSTLAVVLLAAAAAAAVVRRSLRPVARLSASIASIDASSLERRLELHGLPGELRPPFEKVNALLSRIEASLARERQFSADVSHELRTPLAGLRTILEVTGSRDRPAAEYRASLEEALEVVHHLEEVVEDLLLLARLGAGQATAEQREEIPVRALVDACFAPHAAAAARRRLRFDNGLPPGLVVQSERVKLRLVVANLIANAVDYTAEGGWIRVESDPPRGLVLAVRDSGPPVPQEALARLFDPFFRLDPARSGEGHYGIGLALVRGLCDTMGYRVAARNDADGSFTLAIEASPQEVAPAGPAPGAAVTSQGAA